MHKLSTQDRPQAMKDWIGRKRVWSKPPIIKDVDEYGNGWRTWYKGMQPKWRLEGELEWPLVREERDAERWSSLMKGGVNGFVIVLTMLVWWWNQEGARVKGEVKSAIEEVEWVLQQMTKRLRDVRTKKHKDDGEAGQGERKEK